MKTIQRAVITAILAIFLSASSQAQEWIHDKTGMYSAGVGLTQVIFLPVRYYPFGARGSGALSLNIAGEYKVHRFIGLGWQTGLNVFVYGRYYNPHDGFYYAATDVGIPIGFKFNVHILEAANARVKDKLDVYAGFNVGAGPSIHTDPNGTFVTPFIYAGPQVGIRHWFRKVAVFGEFGWGATIANAGVTF